MMEFTLISSGRSELHISTCSRNKVLGNQQNGKQLCWVKLMIEERILK